MRRAILAVLAMLLSGCATAALRPEPTPKEQLLVPPAEAAHFVVVSLAGKHGDEYMWRLPDGRLAFRQSMQMRGLVFEVDETIRLGADGMPVEIQVRGVTPSGDAAESFRIAGGKATWTSPVDQGSAPYTAPAFYLTQGGTFLSGAPQVERLLAAGRGGMATLPSGRATLEKLSELEVDGPQGKKRISLQLIRGISQTPQPVWTEGDRLFGAVFGLAFLPAGYEGNFLAMQKAQEEAIAQLAPAVAARFLTEEARRPVLFKDVQLYDADAERFVPKQDVLVEAGKITGVGAGLSSRMPEGARVIDGRGKTLVPGLWDSHMHLFDDFAAVGELALGVTSYRNPGGSIELAQSQRERRAAGQLLAPEGFSSAIIDQKGPMAAQGSITVSSLDETLAAVRRIKEAGLNGVKFYTSMDPRWIEPAAAEAHRLGLRVHGHIPAGMRTLDAINAGYDEITHIYFATMQAMPEEVVAKSNGMMRLLGPSKYFKDVDLDGEPTRTVIETMLRRGTVVDPTLTVMERVVLGEAGTLGPSYTPYAGTLPAATERGFKMGGLRLPDDISRGDARASFVRLGQYVAKLRGAGVPIVAGTDGYGLELVRELELYVEGGMTPAQALATATLAGARSVGADKRTGSIVVGKEADLVLVGGDPSKRMGDLRQVELVMSDGVLMDGDALRKEAGYSGPPK